MKESGSSRWSAVFALSAALALGACGDHGRPGRNAPEQVGAYLPAPTLTSAERMPDGGVRLAGRAPAGALVRLRSPDGAAATAAAGNDGAWTLTLPPADTPRLYATQAELSGRTVRGEGALAVMPAPGPPALVLRAGFGGVPAGAGQAGRLQWADFDYDGGGAAAGGFAPPQSKVRLTVDGGVAGVSNADAHGRFAVLAVTLVAPGPHQVRVDTPDGLSIERKVDVAETAPPSDKVFVATRTDDGWTVSWRLPGGGVQSSLVFDNAVAAGVAKATSR